MGSYAWDMLTLRGRGFGFCCWWACLLAGCSGESEETGGDEQCSAKACGGDVVGTWNVESFCLTFTEPPVVIDEPECRNLLHDYGVDAEGTLTFSADGMMTSNLTTTTTLEIVLTDACTQALGGTNVTSAMCDSLEAEYQSDPAYSSAGCSFLPGRCSCNIVSVPTTTSTTNPYSIDGNQLITGADASDYCVEGDRLTLGVVVTDGSYSIAARRAL